MAVTGPCPRLFLYRILGNTVVQSHDLKLARPTGSDSLANRKTDHTFS